MAASYVVDLETRLGAHWDHLRAARDLTAKTEARLRQDLTGIDSEDTSVVVLGSLARAEFTSGSDLDWTLVIDGQADPDIQDMLPRLTAIFEAAWSKPPGREGTFARPVFSHDLIHQIGGEDDTNRNTTLRILLLLESSALGRPDAYERVVSSILKRYISEDDGFRRGGRFRVPRFLQNDFARYWRTMTVDFAYKRRTRYGEGATLRNLKLRMSRKLIYAAGLLACFNCELRFLARPDAPHCPSPASVPDCVACLRDVLRLRPLEIMAAALVKLPHLDATARKMFDAYDDFVGMLASARERLAKLPLHPDGTDQIWVRARDNTHDFRDALLAMFFDEESQLASLTKMYGVF